MAVEKEEEERRAKGEGETPRIASDAIGEGTAEERRTADDAAERIARCIVDVTRSARCKQAGERESEVLRRHFAPRREGRRAEGM